MKELRISGLILLLMTLTACPKPEGGDEDDPFGGDPDGVSLVFPENNTECTEGRVENEEQSTITFRWEALENVDSYEVNIKNLVSGEASKTATDTNEADITLLRGVPYEWFIASKVDGSDRTANSETWRFYNQGAGTLNYAPFPAEVVSPLLGENVGAANSIALQWSGSDVDNDIAEYEVLFGTDANPTTSLGVTAEPTMDATVASGQTYYWRVMTKDAQGNTSRSSVFDFSVQ